MRRFLRDDDGYVFFLTLISLPALMGLALLVMDVSRGNNAQSDLYAAADAVALAGARELNGGTDAITRAKAAMAQITNSVHMLDPDDGAAGESLVYADATGNEFTVTFLSDIPQDDHTPIDWSKATTDPTEANYVHVFVRASNLETLFINPLSMLQESVPVSASAVATMRSAACNVVPLYICNPFESDLTKDLQQAFYDGDLHGRLIRLHPKGSDTESPGNFGFLQVIGQNGNTTSSADAIRDIFAGDYNPTCYANGKVNTKPGAAVSIRTGYNARFDIYEAPYANPTAMADYPPALNVRRGYIPSLNGGGNVVDADCSRELADDPAELAMAMPFPDNTTMVPPTDGDLGAAIGTDDTWDINTYWNTNHPSTTLSWSDITPSFAGKTPSRYDVYRYELDQIDIPAEDLTAEASAGTSPMNETGKPTCFIDTTGAPPAVSEDRRVIFAAIIDCTAADNQGQSEMTVNSYASIFMARPMEKNGSGGDGTIDVEIIDITGWGGNGTLETFVREEAVLVR